MYNDDDEDDDDDDDDDVLYPIGTERLQLSRRRIGTGAGLEFSRLVE